MSTAYKLTDIAVRSFKPRDKHYTISDGNGLSLRVFPSGRKLWMLRKMSGGKAITLTLGVYPELSLSDARALASRQGEKLLDMRCKQNCIKQDYSLAHVFELYLSSRKFRESTKIAYRRRFSLLKPLENYELSQINPMMVRAALSPVFAKGTVNIAKLAITLLSSLERFACGLGFIENTKLQYVNSTIPSPPTKHIKSIKAEELPRVFACIKQCKEKERNKVFLLLLMLFFTLLRSNEAANLRWDYVDWDNRIIIVPAGLMKKNREHRLPISSQLYVLLEKLKEQRVDNSPYILSRAGGDKYCFTKALRAAKIDFLAPHGTRSIARTFFAEKCFDFIASEYCLAHRVGGIVHLTYQRSDYLEQRRAIMQEWCDFVEKCYAQYGFVL